MPLTFNPTSRALSKEVSPGPPLVSLRKEITSAMERFREGRDYLKFINAAFGAKEVFRDTNTFLNGTERSSDSAILERALECVASKGRSTKILEVAAGCSYGVLSTNQGAPWLSRGMGRIFGRHAEIVVSDFRTECAAQIFYVTPKGALLTHEVTNLPAFDLPYSSIVGRGRDLKFTPIPDPLRERPRSRGYEALITRACTLVDLYLGEKIVSEGKLFIRPLCDGFDIEFERRAFGITTRPQVDYHEPSIALGDEKFDLIYGRHLFPMTPRVRSGIVKNLSQVIKPSGEVLLEFDHSGLQGLQR